MTGQSLLVAPNGTLFRAISKARPTSSLLSNVSPSWDRKDRAVFRKSLKNILIDFAFRAFIFFRIFVFIFTSAYKDTTFI